MQTLQSPRRAHRVRFEPVLREVRVARFAPLGTEFTRIVFQGDSLHDFSSPGFDDHVKFIVDAAAGEPVRRDYTPRRFDRERRELTIDFALHGHGAASHWARNVGVGQRAVIGGPRGSMVIPTDYDWHLLAGDATAAPAIGRRLLELPAGARALVVVQLQDLTPLEISSSAAQIDLRQVASASALAAAIGGLQVPPGEGFAWCAGEASAMARVRDTLLGVRSHPREAMRVAAYWKSGAAGHREELGP